MISPRQKLGCVPAAFRSARTDDMDPDWLYNGGFIYHSPGNVGINTSTPEHDLDVAGALRADAFEIVPDTAAGYALTYETVGMRELEGALDAVGRLSSVTSERRPGSGARDATSGRSGGNRSRRR